MTDFYKAMNNAGVKTSEADIESEFLKIASEQDLVLSNNDKYSPFWNLIKDVCVKTARWLMVFIAEEVLPNRFLRTAKNEWLDRIGWGYKLPRDEEEKAQGYITFTRVNATGALSIAKNTVIESLPVRGVVYKVIVLNDTAFVEGSLTLNVLCEAQDYGKNYNLAGGLYSVLPESINGITKVINSDNWLTNLGKNKEEDDDYRARIRDLWSGLNSWHVDAVYKRLIYEAAGIQNENIFFYTNTSRGPACVDALILLDVGTVSEQILNDINYYINDLGNHGHGDSVLAVAMPTIPLDLTITAYYSNTLTQEEKNTLLQQLELFIRAAYRELSGSEFNTSITQVAPNARFSFAQLTKEALIEFSSLIDLEFDKASIVHELNVSSLNSLVINGVGED